MNGNLELYLFSAKRHGQEVPPQRMAVLAVFSKMKTHQLEAVNWVTNAPLEPQTMAGSLHRRISISRDGTRRLEISVGKKATGKNWRRGEGFRTRTVRVA